MTTATPDSTHQPASGATPPEAPLPIDPERDIDAKSTSLWLVVSMAFFVVTLIVLKSVFGASLFDARLNKIDRAPLTELTEHRALQAAWLANPKESAEQIAADVEQGADLDAVREKIRGATDRVIQNYLR